MKGGLVKELQGTQEYSPSARRFLLQHGSEEITGIRIQRVPVSSGITSALNAITLGTFSKYAKEEGYDKFFHLGLVIQLGGKWYVVEKLSQISISPYVEDHQSSLEVPIRPTQKGRTFQQFMDLAKKAAGDYTFFTYDPFRNNCQMFVELCLKANGMWREHQRSFVSQPVEEVIKKLPSYTERFARTLTDLGSIAERVVYGAGARGAVLATIHSLT